MQFDPWVGKIPWRRKWHPTLVFLPGKSHGQRSLAGSVRHDWTQSEGNTGALTVLSELRSWTTGIQYPFLHFEEHSKPSSQDVKSTKCPEDLWDSYWWSCSAPQVGPSMRTGEGWLPVVSIAFHFPESQAMGFPEWQFQTADVGWATKDPWQIMDLSHVCGLMNELPPISVLTTLPPLV